MILATSLLLLVLLCQNIPEYSTERYPKKCYTCASLVTSRLCGEGFRKLNFLARDCNPEKKYCIKLVETAGGSAFAYRKCTSHDCEEEAKIRQGVVTDCSVCERSLCNKASTSLKVSISMSILFSALLRLHFTNS